MAKRKRSRAKSSNAENPELSEFLRQNPSHGIPVVDMNGVFAFFGVTPDGRRVVVSDDIYKSNHWEIPALEHLCDLADILVSLGHEYKMRTGKCPFCNNESDHSIGECPSQDVTAFVRLVRESVRSERKREDQMMERGTPIEWIRTEEFRDRAAAGEWGKPDEND